MKDKRQPISSLPTRDDKGPIPFGFNHVGKIGRELQSEVQYRLEDFCGIHQIVYREIETRKEHLDSIDPEDYKLPDAINDYGDLMRLRLSDSLMTADSVNQRTIMFVDHVTIFGLWAICEQLLGKIFRATKAQIELSDPAKIKTPYKWDGLLVETERLGISLPDCDGFENANECRTLNNVLKHHPMVDARLAKFKYFENSLGASLDCVDFEMQRYLNGVSDLLGSFIENANELCLTE